MEENSSLNKTRIVSLEPVYTIDDVLMEYTQAAAALDLYREQNRAVLVELEQRETTVRRREATLKELCRQLGPVENANYAVTVQQKTRRWYDADRILELAPWVRDVPGVLVTSIDKAKIEALVKASVVPSDIAEQALRSEPLTPAVTIRRL